MRNKITIFILVLIILGFSNVASATYIYNNHEYALTTLGLWSAAEAEANAWGGHLVTINDQAEQDWLAMTFPYTRYPSLMIGFNDIVQEGTWVWVSGEPVTYTNWTPGEPNNYNDEDIAVMNWGNPPYGIPYGSHWNDISSSGEGIGIMERVAPVPEPTTMLLLGSGLIGLAGYGRRKFRK